MQNEPASPVVTWQISPFLVQCAVGYDGDRPGSVKFCSYRLNSGMPNHTDASGPNCGRLAARPIGVAG